MLPARPCASGRRELHSPLICLCLCFMIKTPLPSLCFRSLVRRISVFNEPRARISAKVEIRLALESTRGALQGLCWLAVTARQWRRCCSCCGLCFLRVEPGTLTASSGFVSICGETKTTQRLVLSRGESSRLWLFQALLGATLVFPASSSCHQFEDFISLAAASLLESSSRALSVDGKRRLRLVFHGGVSLVFSYHPSTGEGLLVASFGSVGRRFQALCAAVYKSALVALAKLCYYGNDTEKSRHPRQRREPHLFVIIVNG
ncbi:hypothetical protein F2Q69_00054215 [Brassica cretica]|uniref:Uncharacterized protein n=1 Tax=Brassica cretica TaxID=69181 RepID=A0A8S9N2D7_BRACR|nr:hypothetical protein F2Q69_00054215 [Brassica cretica]